MLIELRSAMTQVAHSAMISGAGHSILWKAFELILDRDSSRRQDSPGPKLRQWGVSPWYASISWIILDQHQFQDRHRWCDKQQPCNYCWISERNHFNDINLINSACFRPMGVMSSWCRVSYVWENKSFRHLDIIRYFLKECLFITFSVCRISLCAFSSFERWLTFSLKSWWRTTASGSSGIFSRIS